MPIPGLPCFSDTTYSELMGRFGLNRGVADKNVTRPQSLVFIYIYLCVCVCVSQEELNDLKDQIRLYDAAVKHKAISLDSGGDWDNQLSDSYAQLGIKKVNWKNAHLHRYQQCAFRH